MATHQAIRGNTLINRRKPVPKLSGEMERVGRSVRLRGKLNREEERVRTVTVGDVWIEEDVGDWRAAYRLGLDVRGRVVVSEFRLFPGALAVGPGQWDGEWLGAAAGGIPVGGVRGRTIRACRVGQRLAAAINIEPESIRKLVAEGLLVMGKVLTPAEEESTSDARRGVGRPPVITHRQYKQFAARYRELCAMPSMSRKITRTLMADFNLRTVDQVKSRLRRCKELELLF